MMTTSFVVQNEVNCLLDKSSYGEHNPWGYGSGHTDPWGYGSIHVDRERDLDPGLMYDVTPEHYIGFLYAYSYNE